MSLRVNFNVSAIDLPIEFFNQSIANQSLVVEYLKILIPL